MKPKFKALYESTIEKLKPATIVTEEVDPKFEEAIIQVESALDAVVAFKSDFTGDALSFLSDAEDKIEAAVNDLNDALKSASIEGEDLEESKTEDDEEVIEEGKQETEYENDEYKIVTDIDMGEVIGHTVKLKFDGWFVSIDDLGGNIPECIQESELEDLIMAAIDAGDYDFENEVVRCSRSGHVDVKVSMKLDSWELGKGPESLKGSELANDNLTV